MRRGNNGRFPKGHKPWNWGTKGQGLTGANSGSFKTGSVPPNRKPLWSERTCRDGYVWMKVPEEDPYTGFPTRYKLKHVWIYEQENGPVPEGHVVLFKDQDKKNFDPDNLLAISRADLARLNQAGYKDAPDELKPSILALCRLRTEIGEAGRKLMGTKICSKCKTPKDIKEFHVKKNTPDGLDYKCKQCKSEYAKERNARIKAGKNKSDGRRKKKPVVKTGLKPVSTGTEMVQEAADINASVITDVITSVDVDKMEEQNRNDMQALARAFMAGIKHEFISAMTEQAIPEAGDQNES